MTYRINLIGLVLSALFFIVIPCWALADDPPADPGNTTPSASAAYQYKSQGLFGCNLNGAYSMSIGTMSAIGGVYVPVNDAAVTLNTGILVYKECVLREVVDAERMSATAAIEKNLENQFVSGNGGKGSYPKVLAKDKLDRSDPDALYFFQNALNDLPPSLQGKVKRALAQDYLDKTRNAQNSYTCSRDLTDVYSGDDNDPQDVLASFGAACDPMFAYFAARNARDEYIARGQAEMMTRLGWNNGIYDVEEVDSNNQHITLTPGTLVRDSASNAVQSGLNQLRNANDLGQMTGALYAALATQIVSDARGLAGTLKGVGGQASYLDQVVAEQSANVRSAAVNAAIQVLAAARQVEGTFLQIVTNIANVLTQTIQQLRSMETQCWGFIIQKACTAAPDANNNCTSPSGDHLKVATSTAFSQAVIDAQITPLATPAINNVNAANAAVRLIDQLIASITNTNSLDAQRLALQQLDSLVSQHKIHNQYDLQNAQGQQQAVKDSMTTLIDNTKKQWADSTDPQVGWCNVNQQSVIDMWVQRWKI